LSDLHLGGRFNQSLDGILLPPQLTRLVLADSFQQSLIDWLPPPSLKELILGAHWRLHGSQLRLSPNLRILRLMCNASIPLQGLDWPASLSVLQIRSYSMQLLRDIQLPPTVRVLLLTSLACQAPDTHLPDGLRELHIDNAGREWRLSELQLPSGLQVLSLPWRRFGRESTTGACLPCLPAGLLELRVPRDVKPCFVAEVIGGALPAQCAILPIQ
jgi:hypothetical protein